jgi:hypothetical protein
MKILAVTCDTEKVEETVAWLTEEPGVHIVKVEKLNEYLQNITYSPNWSIVLICIMDEETETILRLKYPAGTFITSVES